MSYYILESRQH